ncbi:hypothetical protein M673_02172 [Aureimonas sp. AU20]|nr:hypothetical protein M673_02172 [Aureimonas sp. AU20]
MPVTIVRDPVCGTLRDVLALILQWEEAPEAIESVKVPPPREQRLELPAPMGSGCALSCGKTARPVSISRPVTFGRSARPSRSRQQAHGGDGARHAARPPSQEVLALPDYPLMRFPQEDGAGVPTKTLASDG